MNLKLAKKIALTMLCSAVFAVSALAQTNVSGKVTDSKGEPIIAAGVMVQNSIKGTVTDIDGNYSLSGVPSDAVLVFSAIGYKTSEVPVSGSVMNVTLADDALLLDDAVVIGYGTQRKGDITSAVASVKSEDFLAGNVQDASDMIKGKVAGLNITKSSGDPNAGSTIRLRGTTTINGDLTPLILVDGVPGDMGTVAPENIADISVLKDASAAAIYGTRGANGVILITTKSGRRGETATVNYSGYVSASTFAKKADFMGVDEVVNGTLNFPDQGYSTDWLDEITRVGFTHNNSVSITGGSQSTTYSASVSYRGEEGVIINTDNRELKMTFDVSQYLLNDMLKLNLNIVKGLHKNTDSNPQYAYRQAIIRNPTSPIYALDASGNEDPSLGYHEEFGRFQYYNPVEILNEADGDTQSEWTNLTGNITLEPIKGWKTNLMLATHRSNSMSEMYYTSKYYSNAIYGYKGSASKSQYNSKADYLELTTTYDKNWDKHRLSALAGYSYNYNMYEGFGAGNTNFPTEAFKYNNLGTGTFLTDKDHTASMNSYKSDNKLIGFFARVSYGYDNRYNVLASLRREGSSKFGEDHKWGLFPSVSFGWNIINENFMENYRDLISNLKLRIGWGVTGIIPGSSYASLVAYDYNRYNKYYDPETSSWKYALAATQNPNPDLSWEKSSEINVGLDFGFWGDRLTGSIDFYNKNTSGLLYNYAVPLPPNLYNYTLANVGKMNNKGVELMVTGVPVRTRDLEWTTTLTLSRNKNKLVSLSNDLYETADYLNTGGMGDPISVSTHRVEVGKETGMFWGLKSVGGLSSNGKWIVEYEDAETGEIVWAEWSGAMNDDTYRQYLGSGVPKLNLGWTNSVRWKNFDLTLAFSGAFGFKILNAMRAFYQNNSIQYNRLKCAMDEFPVYDLTTHEKTGEYTTLNSSSQTQCFVSDYLENGSYLKLDNATLGYTFNLKKFDWIQSARAYISADNVFCITGYTGLDPEIENSNPFWGAGLDDRDKYPTIRSFTFGVNLTF